MSFLPLAIVVFVLVAVAVFAFIAATIAPKSVLGARLRALGSQQPNYYTPPVSAMTHAVRPPVLTPKAIAVVNRLEKLLIEEPNCFTLRACCEAVPEFKTVAYPEKYPLSGVIGCLAGLTCLCLAAMRGENSATFINKPHSELSTVAGAELGLTDAQAHLLFAHWSFDFLQSYRDAKSAADRAKVAIGRIRRFIESGE